MDEVQVGDVFEPKGGAPSQAIEVLGGRPSHMVECKVIETGVTFTAPEHMLLDPERWVRAGYMGSRVLPPTQPKATAGEEGAEVVTGRAFLPLGSVAL